MVNVKHLVNSANYDINKSELDNLLRETVRKNPNLSRKQILQLAVKMYERHNKLQFKNQKVANLLKHKQSLGQTREKTNRFPPQKRVGGFNVK